MISFTKADRLRIALGLALAEEAAAAAGAASLTFLVPFTFASASPLFVGAVAAGHTITRAAILIRTTFDGAGAALSLGPSLSPAMILAPGDVSPGVLATYDSEALWPQAASDSLVLTIAPGAGATQGAGLALVTVK